MGPIGRCLHGGVPGPWDVRGDGGELRSAASAMGWLDEEPPAKADARSDRCRPAHALPRAQLALSGEDDGVRDAHDDARIRRLPGARGVLAAKPLALDEGPEGHAVQPTAAPSRSIANGSTLAPDGAKTGRVPSNGCG